MKRMAKKSMKKKLRKKFRGLLKRLSGVINLKELMSISHYGLEIDKKLKIRNTKISIRQFSRKHQIHQLGHILKLKEMLILLASFLFPKELILINLINFTKKNPKSNFL